VIQKELYQEEGASLQTKMERVKGQLQQNHHLAAALSGPREEKDSLGRHCLENRTEQG